MYTNIDEIMDEIKEEKIEKMLDADIESRLAENFERGAEIKMYLEIHPNDISLHEELEALWEERMILEESLSYKL